MRMNPSRKDILSLIYIRTILELKITYDDKGRVKDFGGLSTTMKMIYNRCVDIEKYLFNNKSHRPIYMDALEVAKIVWPLAKAEKDDFTIHLEPVVAGLYFDRETELKKIGLHSKQFSDMYDSYFLATDCDLEVISRDLVDDIYRLTDKVLWDRSKERKRAK